MATGKDRLPASVSIEELARRRKMKQNAQPAGTKSMDEADVALMRQSLNVVVPDNQHQLNADSETQIQIPVMDIIPYDLNPRKAENERYDDIKDSIRTLKRLNSPLVVTRRPGTTKYMVGKGGNTRLRILQELFEETGDPAFQYTLATYVPWVSELATFADHCAENELRADTIFWDKAQAYAVTFKQLAEEAQSTTLSARALEVRLRQSGLPVSKTTLSYYIFAVNNLNGLGSACRRLTINNTIAWQPAFNAFERLLKHTLQADFWPDLRDQVLRSAEQSWLATGELDPAKIIDQIDQAVALKLGEAVEFVRLARDLCQRFTGEDVAGLVAQARLQMKPSAPSSASKPASPAPASSPEDDPESPAGDPAVAKPPRTRASPAHPVDVDPLAAVQELATRFARMSEVADCLHLMDTWPCGFYMEVPERDEPIELNEFGADRYHGWWMLAMLSDQLDDTWSELLPADSTWRQAQRQENGRDEYALQHYMDTILGMPIDPLTLGKRLATEIDSVSVWMDLVRALRDLRAQAPGRFGGGQ
ncbi:hypothetical protein EZJ19_07715 [Parasulfuritortus cantonensis]|uniref:Chromosome partitioning protein ParB n=1 Tax=Parasulfuritortus cantonensis TaxID=2528202 RepID=A0A4R1BDS1_9PROT|nr:hypothetical protein [Parasulfuritortus cantonensis]TCJ15187.1 hypothetical protein EZJ19_07715 [Parasulfuritortus cantonensis]